MKITIDVAPLTYEYLERLIARGQADKIEDIVDACFITGLNHMYQADVANGIETARD
jgi:hypothetical protein